MRPRDHLDEYLLSDFFRRRAVGEKPVREPEKGGRVPLEQLSGGPRVPTADTFEKTPVFRALPDRIVSHAPSGTAIPETAAAEKGFAHVGTRPAASGRRELRTAICPQKADIPISPSTV